MQNTKFGSTRSLGVQKLFCWPGRAHETLLQANKSIQHVLKTSFNDGKLFFCQFIVSILDKLLIYLFIFLFVCLFETTKNCKLTNLHFENWKTFIQFEWQIPKLYMIWSSICKMKIFIF